jgi:hypothetical protein
VKKIVTLGPTLAGLVLYWCISGMVHADAVLRVTAPWIREAPPTARVHAAYMTLVNTGTEAVLIDSVTSPDFGGAEIHRSWIEDGMARMQPVSQLEVPAAATLVLEPGSYHLMLFDAQRPLTEGDSATLLLHRADGNCISVSAPVVRDSGDGHHHH